MSYTDISSKEYEVLKKRVEELEKENENCFYKFRRLEEKYSQVISNSPVAISISRISDGTFIEVNNAFLDICGYRPEELIGKSAVDLGIWASLEQRNEYINNIRSTGVCTNFEGNLVTASGEMVPVFISGKYFDFDGEGAIITYTRDISEWKAINEKVNEDEERLDTLINAIPDIMCFKDGEGRWLLANDSDLELFDLQGVKYKGKTDAELAETSTFHKQAFLKCVETDENAWQKGKLSREDEEIPKSDGTTKTYDVIKLPIFDSDGNRKSLIVFGRDITKRKAMEKALKKSEEQFRSLFENAPLGMYRSTLDGKILMANSAFLKVIGLKDMDEAKELYIPNIYVHEKKRREFINLASQNKNVTGFETELRRADGTVFQARINSKAHRDENGELAFFEGMVEDISEQKKAQELILKAKEEAEKSDILKSEFLAQMSHEIRTPINSLLNSAFLIKEELSRLINEDIKSAFNIIDNSGIRIIRTIDSILNMSEIQTGTYEYIARELDLYDDILLEVYEEFKFTARQKEIQFRIKKETEKPVLFADEYSLRQIFSNLVDNAMKFTEEGEIKIVLSRNDMGMLSVLVSDTGVGISEHYLPNLFKPFTQEEQGYTRKYEGNGLGLALVKKYTELNKAYIEVISEKGKGSDFIVTFLENGRKNIG